MTTENDEGKPIETLLWKKGQKFNPDKMGTALGVETDSLLHPSFGEFYSWILRPEGLQPVKLEFFEKHRLFRVAIADAPGEYQIRDYTTVEMKRLESSGISVGLKVKAVRPGHFSIVTVLTSGVILEVHQLGLQPGTIENYERNLVRALVPSEILPAASNEFLTVDQIAEQLRVPASTIRYHIREGNLNAVQVGRRLHIVPRESLDLFILNDNLRVLKGKRVK